LPVLARHIAIKIHSASIATSTGFDAIRVKGRDNLDISLVKAFSELLSVITTLRFDTMGAADDKYFGFRGFGHWY
jgi:hypothetical protein